MYNILSTIRKIKFRLFNMRYYPKYLLNNKLKIKKDSILFIIHDLEKQGSELLAYHIIKEYVDNDINVCVVSFRIGPLASKFSDIVPLKIWSASKIQRKINKLCSKYEISKAICNTIVTGNVVKELHENDFYVICLVHELKTLIIQNNYTKRCEDIAMFANCVVFPSEVGYKSFCDCVSKKDFNYRIKNQGLFLTKESNIDYDSAKKYISETYNIPYDAKIIINVATANERKGIDLFLDTVNELESDNKIYFIWVGNGTNKYVKQKLKQYNKTTFSNLRTPGYISDEKTLSDIYISANLLFLTSREEPFGSIVLEAFNARTPVVAFDGCGGYVDIVKDGTTGVLIQPFNISNAVYEIQSIIYDEERIKRMSDYCYKESKKHKFDKYCQYIFSQFSISGEENYESQN